MIAEGMPLHGAHVSIKTGSLIQILTADHPRDPALRRQSYERGIPSSIGENVWIGSSAIILPGVSIGDDAIIGARRVVRRDVPTGATVMGNPVRISVRQE
jgi:maltose O-acetyltransferase